MKVKIVKCSSPVMWWVYEIGNEFTVVGEYNGYWLLYPNGKYVSKSDCEVVEQ